MIGNRAERARRRERASNPPLSTAPGNALYKSVAITAVNANQTTWAVSSLESSYQKGANWEGWGVTPTSQDSTTVTFHGQKALDILAKHDVVIFNHYLDASIHDALRRTADKKITLLNWTNFEAKPTGGHFSTIFNPLDQVFLDHLFFSGNFDWPDFSPEYVAEYFSTWSQIWTAQGYSQSLNGLFFDNMLTTPFMTPTPPAPLDTGIFQAGWNNMLSRTRAFGVGEIWGNTGVDNFYGADMMFLEHLFRAPETISGAITKVAAAGKGVVGVNEEVADVQAVAPTLFEPLRLLVPATTNLFLQTLRSGEYLFKA